MCKLANDHYLKCEQTSTVSSQRIKKAKRQKWVPHEEESAFGNSSSG